MCSKFQNPLPSCFRSFTLRFKDSIGPLERRLLYMPSVQYPSIQNEDVRIKVLDFQICIHLLQYAANIHVYSERTYSDRIQEDTARRSPSSLNQFLGFRDCTFLDISTSAFFAAKIQRLNIKKNIFYFLELSNKQVYNECVKD